MQYPGTSRTDFHFMSSIGNRMSSRRKSHIIKQLTEMKVTASHNHTTSNCISFHVNKKIQGPSINVEKKFKVT